MAAVTGAALGAAAVAALAGSAFWIAPRPSSASAETVLHKASQATAAAGGQGVHSFVLAQTTLAARPWLPEEGIGSPYKRGEQYRTVSTRWFEAPDRVRDELEEAVLEPDGTFAHNVQWVTVRDGTSEWLYRPQDNTLVINVHEPAYKAQGGRSPHLPAIVGVGDVLQPGRGCSTVTLRGSGAVAGRDAYVIEFGPADLARCPPVDPAWRLIGRRVLWLDKATFFVLKEKRYDRADGGLRSTLEVTRVEYDVPIDPERFTFTPPAGATVRDLRPPLPDPAEFQQDVSAR